MKSLLLLLFANSLLSQNTDVYLRIDPDTFPVGVHYFNTARRGDALAFQTMTWLNEVVVVENVLEWIGGNQLFFLVSRLDKNKPIKIEVIYRRFWIAGQSSGLLIKQPCVYNFSLFTKGTVESEIKSDIKKVLEKAKNFPKTGPPPTDPAIPIRPTLTRRSV